MIDRVASSTRPGRVVSNTMVQFAGPGLRLLLGLALGAALSRSLGVAGFGRYALVFTYVAAFSGIFSDWGISTICLREIAQRPAERTRLTASAATLQGLIALASYLLMLCSLVFLRYPRSVVAGIAIYGLSILLAPLDILALPFQADLQMSRLLAPSLLGVGLNFVLSMAVILLHGPLLALIGAALGSLLVQYTIVTLLSLRVLGSSIRPSTPDWAFLIGEAWPLGAATTIATVFQQAPILILSLFTLEGVGLYNAASKIPMLLLTVPLALRATFFPLLSAAWATDRNRFRGMLRRLITGSLMIAVPTVVLGTGLAGPLMTLLFGHAFAAASVPFALLISVFAVMFPVILLGEAITAAGFQRLNLGILTAGLPLLLLLLAILVPAGGASGAALALLSSYAVIAGATALGARVRLGISFSWKAWVHAGIAIVLGEGTLVISANLQASFPLSHLLSPTLGALVALVTLWFFQHSLVREIWQLRPVGSTAESG